MSMHVRFLCEFRREKNHHLRIVFWVHWTRDTLRGYRGNFFWNKPPLYRGPHQMSNSRPIKIVWRSRWAKSWHLIPIRPPRSNGGGSDTTELMKILVLEGNYEIQLGQVNQLAIAIVISKWSLAFRSSLGWTNISFCVMEMHYQFMLWVCSSWCNRGHSTLLIW